MEMIGNFSTKCFLCDSLIHRNETFHSMTMTKHFSGRGPRVQCRPEQTGEKPIPQYLVLRTEKSPKFSTFALALYFSLSTLASRLFSEDFTFFFLTRTVCVRGHTCTHENPKRIYNLLFVWHRNILLKSQKLQRPKKTIFYRAPLLS